MSKKKPGKWGVVARMVDKAGRRITDGRPPKKGQALAICNQCRYPFALARANGNCRRVCADCRELEVKAYHACLSYLRRMEKPSRPGCGPGGETPRRRKIVAEKCAGEVTDY